MKLRVFSAVVCAFFSAISLVAAGDLLRRPAERPETFKVTIQNLAPTQPLSPPVVAAHKGSVGMFRVGEPASPGLEAIAEDGNQGPMYQRFRGLVGSERAVDVARPLTPAGRAARGFTDSVTFEIEAGSQDVLSMAAMLICTNDGFVGLDRRALPFAGSRVYLADGYDAGTEDNTELAMDIVDACSALGPVTIGADPDGNLNDPVDTDPRGDVAPHPGVMEVGDLLAAHGWTDPVAKVTVTRVDPAARTFSTLLRGAGEVPIVESDAYGRARLRLIGEDEVVAVRFVLHVNDIVDPVQAHIHMGSPDENGPVVAFLFGPQAPGGPFGGALADGYIEKRDLLGPLEGNMAGFVEALRKGELYINVHTEANPSGEIRGQIGAAGGRGRIRLLKSSGGSLTGR